MMYIGLKKSDWSTATQGASVTKGGFELGPPLTQHFTFLIFKAGILKKVTESQSCFSNVRYGEA